MRTNYRIDDFQESYFVIRDLDELLEFTRIDFAPLYESAAQAPELQPGDVLPTDQVFSRGDGSYHRARRTGGTP
jgi:phenylalanine-4-hydroxylase